MFLKTLVIRGFKSFADKTALTFEPGVSVIVGPNGSGKSNVIDAVSWVLGEQGPSALRGGRMEDVIFAGSKLRPALGMAEVSLTIDNSAGLLPIEFNEVTISRLLFRSGESEYRINGAPCRLLDIQELLSDSGIGREQHTIVGQGQLDTILTADPMEIRGFIEEAAGVAKHRRRKDRALRKIASTEQNLVRLSDLLSEIRRQLRPLREQAEVAKRFTLIEEELRRVRTIVGARELAELRRRLGPEGGVGYEGSIRQLELQLGDIERGLTEAEQRRTASFGVTESSRETAWGLVRVGERFTSLSRLAAERRRAVEAELNSTTHQAAQAKVTQIGEDLAQVRESIGALEAEVGSARAVAEQAGTRLDAKRAELGRSESLIASLRSDHRSASADLLRRRSQQASIEGQINASSAELARLQERAGRIAETHTSTLRAIEEGRSEAEQLEIQARPLEEELQEMDTRVISLGSKRDEIDSQARRAERELERWAARAAVHPGDPEAARRIAGSGLSGVHGVLADLVSAREDLRRALDAIAGPADSVLVVEDAEAAAAVMDRLEDDEAVGVLVCSASDGSAVTGVESLAEAAGARDAARRALSGIALASSAAEAARAAAEHPGLLFVTSDGAAASGPFVIRTAKQAQAAADAARQRSDELRALLRDVDAELRTARGRREELMAQVNSNDARLAALGERLSALEREAHAAEREASLLDDAVASAQQAESDLKHELQSIEASLPATEKTVEELAAELESAQNHRAGLRADLESLQREGEAARLATARAEERLEMALSRSAALEAALAKAEAEAEGVDERREDLARQIDRIAWVIETAGVAAGIAEKLAQAAERHYLESRQVIEEAEGSVSKLRERRAEVAGELDDLRNKAREQDMGISEFRVRARILEEKMTAEWRVDPEDAVRRFGHVWEVEDASRIEDPLEKLALLDDEALRRKHQRLERDIASMGTVNPMAQREFQALTEREEFLQKQIADVRSSRRDLFKVVHSVEEEIRRLFQSAYEDVAREYERLFALMFPGGQGRLRLTDPNDLLTSGVEIEARPGGKNLRRLSLLSGGEKALSALALLFAIFRSRPSPFYILDEVEAALDDVNLHRFLELLRQFQETSQLIVVTHQKRTMEIADVLYGVSIRPDGATRVLTERLSSTDGLPALAQDPSSVTSDS